jgi:hypothetical protein
MKRRLLHLLIALDQLAWVLLTLGKGHPDETISAALWRMEQQGKIAGRIFRPMVDLLFRPIEKDHCYRAWLSEVQRSQLPSAYKG